MPLFPRIRLASHIFNHFSKDRYLSLTQEGLLASNSRDMFLEYDMTNKVCMVTGATTGIGFEIANTLAKRGAHVHIVCRNKNEGNRALNQIQQNSNNSKLTLHTVDLSNVGEVDAFTTKFVEENKERGLHVLINNAGGSDYPLKTSYEEILQYQSSGKKLTLELLKDANYEAAHEDPNTPIDENDDLKQLERGMQEKLDKDNIKQSKVVNDSLKLEEASGEDEPTKEMKQMGYFERKRALDRFMLPEKTKPHFNDASYEKTFAVNTLSAYLLSTRLSELLEKGAQQLNEKSRVVLTSDGAIYSMRKGLHSLLAKQEDYHPDATIDPVHQYILSKRAVLSINHALAYGASKNQLPIVFNAYHPGFVDTKVFHKFHAPWSKIDLRTAAQGADTALFLAMSPEVLQNERYEKGGLFFEDRCDVPEEYPFSAPAHSPKGSSLFAQNIERSLQDKELITSLKQSEDHTVFSLSNPNREFNFSFKQ